MSEAQELRVAIGALPRAENHRPGESVKLGQVYMVASHRAALDPERSLVVGNRGMGKSFWTHALADHEIREQVAAEFNFPMLRNSQVRFGFNGSERDDPVAPTPAMVTQVGSIHAPLALWRAVMVRAVGPWLGDGVVPQRFSELVEWVEADAERYAALITQADEALGAQRRYLLLVFDALERVGADWGERQQRVQGLLQLSLAAQSYRNIRLKVFLRADQYEDRRIFEFADGAKLRNTAVTLWWWQQDLYALLFQRLRSSAVFRELEARLGPAQQDRLVSAMAGEFMGAGAKRGRVYSWLPTHLADGRGQISPRTFLTAWRESALATPAESDTAVSHHGIQEGVRCASRDRLNELAEDYPWVTEVLGPLRGQSVPLEATRLFDLWRRAGDVATALIRHFPEQPKHSAESLLLMSLVVIGVMEHRPNGKVNVPDIFRVEAGIKRRGGVKPPRKMG